MDSRSKRDEMSRLKDNASDIEALLERGIFGAEGHISRVDLELLLKTVRSRIKQLLEEERE